jgi:MFS family permease
MMNVAMEGWFVGSALLGCIIGVAFAGILSDTFGRKKILFISALLFTISAIGCMVLQEQFLLITFRLIGGMGVGIASMVSPLYISEISPPELRGRLVTLYQFAITIGILSAYFVNAFILSFSQNFSLAGQGFFHWIFVQDVWRAMFGSETIPALLFFFLLFFVPKSPRWLITKGHPGKAQKILTRIAGSETAEQEVKGMQEVLDLVSVIP